MSPCPALCGVEDLNSGPHAVQQLSDLMSHLQTPENLLLKDTIYSLLVGFYNSVSVIELMPPWSSDPVRLHFLSFRLESLFLNPGGTMERDEDKGGSCLLRRRKSCKIIEMFTPKMYLLLIFILKSRNSVFLTYFCLNLLTGNSKATSDNLNCCPSPV